MNYLNNTVSVIIPVYNAEKYIAQTVESVLNQSYNDVEIILIDDCSTDNTKTILNAYQGRIKYKFLQTNSGVAVARNTGLKLAKGRYVAFLDSDDVWYPEKLKKQISCMNEKNAAICYTAIEMIDSSGNIFKEKRPVLEKVDYQFLLRNTMIATSSVVIDRNKTDNFQMPLIRSGQDYATWLQLLRKTEFACGINEVLVKYRTGQKSLSSKKWRSIGQVWTIQTRQEHINIFKASVNTLCFSFNALKKYLF